MHWPIIFVGGPPSRPSRSCTSSSPPQSTIEEPTSIHGTGAARRNGQGLHPNGVLHGVEKYEGLVDDVLCLPRCPGCLCWQSHVSRRLFINRLSHPPSITSYLRPPFPPAIGRLCFLVHHQDSLATVLACNSRGSRVKVLASLLPSATWTIVAPNHVQSLGLCIGSGRGCRGNEYHEVRICRLKAT